MARSKHVVGTSGVPCRNREAVATLRESELRLTWRSSGEEQWQTIAVHNVRNWVRQVAENYDEIHLDWRAEP